MNPNDQYFQQQQPGYGAPQLGQNYGGMMPPPPRTPVMVNQPQQFPPANGPQNMNPYGQPSPRPPMTQYGHSPLPPQAANPNQLAQQMGGMNLGDNSLKSPVPSMYPPMNGNVSPAPGTFPSRPPMASNLLASPMPPQSLAPGIAPPRPGLMPPMQQQQQQMRHVSPQQYPNGPGMDNMGHPVNGQQFNSPRPPTGGGFLPTQTAGFPGHPPMPFQQAPLQQHQQQSHLPPTQQQQGGYDSMGSRYPSSPNYPPGMSGPMPGPPSQPMPPQQQARRLDPDQMPSAIQVMEDDKRTRSGPFATNQKGLVPPLVTTPYLTQDQGNSGPRFVRSSMYSVPALPDMMKQTAVPFGLVICPFAQLEEGEQAPPVVDMGELGPVRCGRCKAYMCPFMQFIDGGRRFQCPFCKATTEVPAEYFQHLDHTGMRMDKYQRPELCLGSYEFVGTKDYCRNNVFPKPPAYIFVLDVSYNNVKSGLVHLLCQNIKSILQHLPRESVGGQSGTSRVGFITYSKEVHFYNIKASLAQPQMMVVGDVEDMFMPLLDGFLCDPVESEHIIDQLMVQIPTMFADSRETETILGPAIKAGLEALKAADCVGKLLVFHSSLPIAEAPGRLKSRDERKLLGTDKERTVLSPQTTFYNQIGQECAGVACRVDLFVANNAFVDLATIGQVARLTGGQVYKYTYFQADLDGERLVEDVRRNVEQTVAFDSIMRVRTSTGVRPVDFYGHFFMSNTTDVETAGIDSDQAMTIEIKHDDKLTDEDGVYIQVALLFTSPGGQRRLRIHNLALSVCTQMADLYRSCDLDTVMNLLMKQSVTKLTESTPKQIRDSLINRSAQVLACYRKNCASPSSPGQLILPECMKLLPLYINCLLNCDALSGGSDMSIDDRTFNMFAVQTMHVGASLAYLYPRLVPLLDASAPASPSDQDEVVLPSPVRCTGDKLRDDGVYVLDNGIHMFLWIGLSVSPEWIHGVFGTNSAAQIDIDRTKLIELDNPRSQQVRSVIAQLRSTRQRHMRLTLVRPRDKLEFVFRKFLVEDKHGDASSSYVDFLCHLHKEIRNLLN